MTKEVINIGVAANDGTGDSLREGAIKVNNNFTELYASLGDGARLKISTTGAASGQVLAYNGTTFVPTASVTNTYSTVSTDVGITSASAPGSTLNIIGGTGITTTATSGTIVINSTGGGGSGGASVTLDEVPPTTPSNGDLWFDSSTGILAVWYDAQGYWVQTNSSAAVSGDINISGGGGGSASTFLDLLDTPVAYTTAADKYLKVNTLGSEIEFVDAPTGSGGSSLTFIEINDSSYTATSNEFLFIDTTTNTITVSLPDTATLGDEVRFLDVSGTFTTNNLTITSSSKIQGVLEDFIVDVDFAGFSLVYVNAAKGWLLKDK
jgi:hypothetical protein